MTVAMHYERPSIDGIRVLDQEIAMPEREGGYLLIVPIMDGGLSLASIFWCKSCNSYSYLQEIGRETPLCLSRPLLPFRGPPRLAREPPCPNCKVYMPISI